MKVKAEQIELNEAEGQAMQLPAATRPGQATHPVSAKRPSTDIVIKDGPKKKKLRKTILTLSEDEDEDIEDKQTIGESQKKLKQASTSAIPTRPR